MSQNPAMRRPVYDDAMNVGIVGTGAVAKKHAQAYRNIGNTVTVCTNTNAAKGMQFAAEWAAEFVSTVEEVCRHPRVDFVDVCTPPGFRLPAVLKCAVNGKHVLVEKPMATNLETARAMLDAARQAEIQLGVVSQHRFDNATQFLKRAIADGRLGRIIQADAYVKWYRPPEYYSRAFKGSWAGEGGGALIGQGIHAADLLLYLAGAVRQVFGYWQLGAVHPIEAEDAISAVLRYASGATGVIQAATALWPGYRERIEIHGTRGTAIVTGDKLTAWDVQGDAGGDAPIADEAASGASDPMAISLVPFERQMLDFGRACAAGTPPLVSGEEGYRALALVTAIYESCRQNAPVEIPDAI